MWNSQEIKSVKNAIIKKSTAKAFQVCISLVHDSFILEFSISISISTVTGISINITVISISISTALLLGRYRKIRTSFKTLVSKKTTIWWLKKSHSNNKLLELNNVFQLSHRTKSIRRSKLYLKIFLQLPLLKVCESIKKLEVYFGLYEPSFYIYRGEKTK